jgi:hypothetical protein
MHSKVQRFVLVLAALGSSACAHNVPLGGIGAGRGRPVQEGLGELMLGAGFVPDVSGTAPELVGDDGYVANPVLSSKEIRLRYPLVDVGIALPLGDRFDAGWSLSRGLHGMAEVVRARQWSLTLSPALFWWKGRDAFGADDRGSTRNLNLTALASFRHVFRVDEEGDPETRVELWAGAGANRYRLTLETRERAVAHAASPVSAVAGGSMMTRGMRVGFEFGGAWVTQRQRPREFAPAARFYVFYVVPSAARRLRAR